MLEVKRLSPNAILPTRATPFSAGHDLYSAEYVVVPKRGRALVKTDLSIAIPYGTYARVASRSGLSVKNGIETGAGVVDFDYRGNVGVVLHNLTDVDFVVEPGFRIAQLILEKIDMSEVVECTDELPSTDRGANGFGSSGIC